MIECIKCGQTKEPEAFHVNSKNVSGRDNRCKECVKEYNHNYHLKKYTLRRHPEIKAIRFETELSMLNDQIEEALYDFSNKQRQFDIARKEKDYCLEILLEKEEKLRKLKAKIFNLKYPKENS